MKSKSESKWNFLAKWMLAHAAVGFVIWFGWFQLNPSFTWFTQYSVAALMGLLFALVQFLVIPKKWLVSPIKWLIGSSIGWLIGSFFFTSLVMDYVITDYFVLMPFYVVPSALIQSWMLNKRFKRAWLWLGAVLAGGLVDATFSNKFSFSAIEMQITAQTIIPALQAIITGSILIYMSQALSREDNLIADESQNTRLERLQEAEDMATNNQSDSFQKQSKSNSSI